MNYYIKLHYLTNLDYKGIVHISEIYNQTLELFWKGKEIFYVPSRDEDEDKIIIYWEEFEETDILNEIFEVEWIREIWDTYYVIIKINFIDIIEDEIDGFQDFFLDLLKDKIQLIYKFEDNRFLEIRKQFFEDIYKIEISLREVISFIFFTTYYDFWNFLKDLKINTVTKSIDHEDILKRFENEFFYISFSDYKNLLELRDLKENEKIELLKGSTSFDEWKNRIFERGIKDEPYVDFIESIKQDLETLENFRNSLMHNRSFWIRLKQSYEMAQGEILRKIEDFKNTHINIFWNELGLIVWKEYEYIWPTTENFIQWKKYKLTHLLWGDSIFQWEIEENSIPFFDKEIMQYFNIY